MSHKGEVELLGCGTYAGYQQHRLQGEKACEPCRVANNKYAQDRRKRPEIKERHNVDMAARNRALWRLADIYRSQFRVLVEEEKRKCEA